MQYLPCIGLTEAAGLPIGDYRIAYGPHHEYLLHLGPNFLAETLPQRILDRQLSMMKFDCFTRASWRFKIAQRIYHEARCPAIMMGPASPHQLEGILGELSRIPEEERPSAGWIWFAYKYDIPSQGIGPEVWYAQHSNMPTTGAENELSWGYPFWDIERLRALGVDISWAAGSLQHPV
jgi:hypothetical protein